VFSAVKLVKNALAAPGLHRSSLQRSPIPHIWTKGEGREWEDIVRDKGGKGKRKGGEDGREGKGQVWLPASAARSASGHVKFAVVYRQLPVGL